MMASWATQTPCWAPTWSRGCASLLEATTPGTVLQGNILEGLDVCTAQAHLGAASGMQCATASREVAEECPSTWLQCATYGNSE